MSRSGQRQAEVQQSPPEVTGGSAVKTGKKPIRTEIDDKKVLEDIEAGKGLAPLVTVADKLPEEARDIRTNGAGVTKKSASKKAKAKQPTAKLTPASIFRKLIVFGKTYQIEEEQDFREAARIYSEEAALIDQMRKRLKEDGLTVMKTYKTGDCEVAHPLLSELPRHVESANKCLMTISSMIEERGAKKQKPTRDLDQFRLHA